MNLFENLQLFKKVNEYKDYSDDYDRIFGEPTTEVITPQGVLDYIDEVIKCIDKSTDSLTENLNSNDFIIKRIIATNYFEKAIKGLYKLHKKDVLEELKDAIEKLCNYEITSNKKNHPLQDMDGHLDLHLDGGNLILIYKYENENTLKLYTDESSLNQLLKLQDVVNHDKLKKYKGKKNKRRLKSKTHDFDLDTLDKYINND